MGSRLERFPLFPLGLVLLPGEVVPLHIFEDRYKLMIAECLEEQRELGIVWISDRGLREVGCSAQITQLLERMEDGRMNILIQGAHPFRLLRRIDDLPYPAGHIELLEEETAELDLDAGSAARKRYADIVERATDSRPSENDLAELDAYGMAATIDLGLEQKQELLELRSESTRLARLDELLRATIKRIDYSERVAEHARSDGKVRL